MENENSAKFTLAIDRLNKKIAELNIKISKDFNNDNLNAELHELLKDKNKLYKADSEEFIKLIDKYGSNK